MFKVTTTHLDDDIRSARAEFGTRERGEYSADALWALLEAFAKLDTVQNNEAEPQLIVTARAGKFVVRTSAGRLFLYEAHEMHLGCTELDAGEIVAQLDRAAPVAAAPEEEPAAPPRSRRLPNAIALAMIAAGLALVGYTLSSAMRIDDVNQTPPLALLVDQTEIAQQTQSLAGTFATGNDEGDRAIVLEVDGKVRLRKLGPRGAVQIETVSIYRLGRRDRQLYLDVANGGQIEVTNRDTLVYYRDTYRRAN